MRTYTRAMSVDAPPRFTDVEAAKLAHDPEIVDRIVASAFESDESADRLVAAFAVLPGGAGWRMLDRALAEGLDAVPEAPPALGEVLGPVLHPPAWVDFEAVDAGAVAWWRGGGMVQLLTMTAGSLAYGYRSASLTRPLAATGRLAEMAPRRLGETSRWVLAAARPGAMRPGAPGLHDTVRLRLLHALIRAHLRRAGGWDTTAWGEPISVGDTLATGMGGFFLIPLEAMRDLGVRHERAELESMFALWRWISFVMGVPERHLPATLEEAEATIAAALTLDGGPNADSPRLMRALLFHGLGFDRLPGPLGAVARGATGQLLGGFARRWLGDDMADRLEVPNTPLKRLAPVLRPLTRARSRALATGAFGSQERIVELEYAVMERVLAAVGAAPAALRPEAVERESRLAA